MRPYFVLYELNGRFYSVIINSDTEETATQKFKSEYPTAKLSSIAPFGCAR